MLVVTRRVGEELLIGDDIQLIVLKCGTTVRLGIKAPTSVKILRKELLDGKGSTNGNGDSTDVRAEEEKFTAGS